MPVTAPRKLSRSQQRLLKRLRAMALSVSERLLVDRFYVDGCRYPEISALLDVTETRARELHQSLLAQASAAITEEKRREQLAAWAKKTKRKRK